MLLTHWIHLLTGRTKCSKARRGRFQRRELSAKSRVERFEDRSLLAATLTATLDAGNLVITDTTGVANLLTLQLNVTQDSVVISDASEQFAVSVIAGATLSNSDMTITIPLTSITGSSINVLSDAGDDSLVIDLTNGNFATKAVSYDGGTQTTSDSLTLTGGGTFASVAHSATSASAGTIEVTGNALISYLGLEPVTDNLSATDRTFTFTGDAETIIVTDDPAPGMNKIDSTLGESVTFANPSGTLTINAGSGDDLIQLTSIDAAFAAALTINGGTEADTVNLNATGLSVSSLSISAETMAQTAAVTVSGATTLDASATGSITLADAVNVFSTVSITAADTASLRDDGGFDLGTSAIGSLLTIDSAGSVTQSGVLSGTAALTKLGAGTLTLSQTNTYSGPTMVNGGGLTLSGGTAIIDTGAVVLTNALGVLMTLTASEEIGSLVGGGNFGGDLMLGANTLTAGGNNSSTIYNGKISGTGGITKVGTGKWTVNNPANSYSGPSTITLGILATGDASKSIGDGSATNAVIFNGGTLAMDGFVSPATRPFILLADGIVQDAGSNNTIAGVISGAFDFIKNNTGNLTLTGANTFGGAGNTVFVNGGAIVFNSDTRLGDPTNDVVLNFGILRATSSLSTVRPISLTASCGFDAALGSVFTVDSMISGTGLLSTNAPGDSTGVVVLTNGANNYTGLTTVDGGTTRVTANNALGSIVLGTQAATGTTLDFRNVTYSAVESVLLNNATLTNSFGVSSIAGPVRMNTETPKIDLPGTQLTIFGPITGGSDWLRNGSGLLILNGITDTLTGTGSMTQSGGTTLINGTTNVASAIIINAGTLGGTGLIGGPVTINSTANLSPGPTTSALGTGNLLLATGSILDLEIGGTGLGSYDHLLVSGTVMISTLGVGVTLNLTQFGGFVPSAMDEFILIDNDNDGADAVVGTFAGLPEGTLITNFLGTGASAKLSYIGGDGNDVTIEVNSAPFLNSAASPELTDIDTDNVTSAGDSIAVIVVDGSITDADGAVEAIAVTAVDNTNGVWQYSIDDGTNWIPFTGTTGAVVNFPTTARLLDGTLMGASTQKIRFAPDLSFTGTATFTFRAWDTTTGIAGGTADATINGGTTAFSTDFDTASIFVGTVETDVSLSGGDLIITDINGGISNDLLTIKSDTALMKFIINDPILILQTSVGTLSLDGHTVEVPFASVPGTQIVFDTLAGNDLLTIDFSLGNFGPDVVGTAGSPALGLGDTLALTGGGSFTTVTHNFLNENDGSIAITDNGLITYTGIEALSDALASANREFSYEFGAETITVTDAVGAGLTSIDSTFSQSVTFSNPTDSLTISAGAGNDIVTVTSVDAALTAALTISGDADTDAINLNAALSLGSGTSTGTVSVLGESINVTAAINTTAVATGSIWLNGTLVSIGANLSTDGGVVALIGTTAVQFIASTTIDTESGNNSNAGAVSFAGSGQVQPDGVQGRDVTINTTTTFAGGIGGAVTLVTFGQNVTAINDINIDSRAATNGVITVPGNLTTDDNGVGGPGSITLAGNVRLTASVSFSTADAQTSGGPINLQNANVSATAPNADLTLLSGRTAVGGNGGNVTLGVFNSVGGQFVDDLLINADNLATTAGNVSVTAAVELAGNLTVDRAHTITLSTAASSITVSGAKAVLLTADASIDLQGTITAGAAGVVTLIAGGTVLDNHVGTDVTGGNLVINSNGVSSSANPLETLVSNLEATGGAGGIFITNTGSLTIGGIGATLGVSATGGGITITVADGGLTVSELVTDTNNGAISLAVDDAGTANDVLTINAGVTASGAGNSGTVTLHAGEDVALNAAVSAGAVIVINANDDVTSTVAGTLTSTKGGISLTADQDAVGGGTLNLAGAIASGTGLVTVSLPDADGEISGIISGSGGFLKNGVGTLRLSGVNNFTSTTTVAFGTLLIDGSTALGSPVTVNSGATLGGSGTAIGTVTLLAGGTINPGSPTAATGVLGTGPLALPVGSTFTANLVLPSDYDSLDVTGSVVLTDSTFNPLAAAGLGVASVNGTTLLLINNDLADPVVGEFFGLPEGTVITLDGRDFTLTYIGGDGNDVELFAEPNLLDVYVDDDWEFLAPGVDPDGPLGPAIAIDFDAFPTIQEGVNAVSTNGTVHVYAGPYPENVTITRSVVIDGVAGTATFPEPDAVIVDPAAGDGFTIGSNAKNVFLSDMTIQDAVNGITASNSVNLTLTNIISINHSNSGLTSTSKGDLTINGGIFDGINVTLVDDVVLGPTDIVATDNVSILPKNTVTLTGSLDAGDDTVSISANLDGVGSADFTMAPGTQISTTNGTAAAINITVNSLVGGSGDALLQELLTGVDCETALGGVTVDATVGAVIDGNGAANNIIAATTVLRGQAGVGSVGDPIETMTRQLEGVGGSGGFFVTNDCDLLIGGISGTTGISTTTGDLIVLNTGSLTVTENVIAGGLVFLKSVETAGSGDDLSVQTGAIVRSIFDDVVLEAGDNLTLASGSLIESLTGTVFVKGDCGNADALGTTIAISGLIHSAGGAIVNGDTNADSLLVNAMGTGGLTLDGLGGNDAYVITYPVLPATFGSTITVNDSVSGDDRVSINGTNGPDEVFLTTKNPPTTAATEEVSRGTLGSEKIVLSNNVEGLKVFLLDGNDIMHAQPSMLFPVLLDGGSPGYGEPGVPPGDRLFFDPLGDNFSAACGVLMTGGGSPNPFFDVEFVNFESLLLEPLGVTPGGGLFFDLNHTNTASAVGPSPTQAGYVGVQPTTLFSGGLGYGWQSAVKSFERDDGFYKGGFQNLIRDGHWLDAPATFTTTLPNGWYSVSVMLGSPYHSVSGVSIKNADTNNTLSASITTGPGESKHVNFVALVTDGTLDLRFAPATIYPQLFAVNGITIRPANLFSIGLASNPGPLPADGVTVNSLPLLNGPANSLLTVTTSLGTIVNSDADPELQGIQIPTNALGQATLLLRRPTGAGTAQISIEAVTGATSGCVMIDFVLPTGRNIDFNHINTSSATGQSPTQAPVADLLFPGGFLGVPPTQLYAAPTGYGWLSAPRSFDLGAQTDPLGNLRRDGAVDTVSRTFRVDLPNGTYEYRATIGYDRDIDGMRLNANGSVTSNISVAAGKRVQIGGTFTVSSGFASFAFADLGGVAPNWVINGLQIRSTASVLPITFTPNIGNTPADGMTITPVSATTTLANGQQVTIATTLGTITTPDVNSTIDGIQVLVASSKISFSVKAPTTPGTPTLSAVSLDGLHRGETSAPAFLTFAAPTGRRFDFNHTRSASSLLPSPTTVGFVGVLRSDINRAATGFGWNLEPNSNDVGVPNEFDQGGSNTYTKLTTDLYRDYHSGHISLGSRTFSVQAAGLTAYDLRVYLGTQDRDTSNKVTVEGIALSQTLSLPAKNFQFLNFVGASDTDADGFIEITFTSANTISPLWATTGLDIAVSGSGLPLAAPLTAIERGTGVGRDLLTADELAPLVAVAINAWQAHGLTPSELALLQSTEFVIRDLGDNGALGIVDGNGRVIIDDNGAGWGWSLQQDLPSDDRYDLLTVIAHELGHRLGLEDLNPEQAGDELMNAFLGKGDRHDTLNGIDGFFSDFMIN